ncbi:MAG: NEW3 domain-containing protein [Deltaproteobacteria bacterium]|nr:NEW3 domain-containing protein [Deltaproteobacteria bacterium]
MRIRRAHLVWLLLAALVAFWPLSGTSHETSETAAKQQDIPDDQKEPFELVMAYNNITVGPGQEFEMDAEVVNPRRASVRVALETTSLPEGWTAGFHSRYPSFPVGGIMVQGGKNTTLELKVKLPDNVEPGDYELGVTAKDSKGEKTEDVKIAFRVSAKKVDTGGLKMESQYPVLSGTSDQTFKFGIDLKNETDNPLTTALAAQAPPGWVVRIKPQFEDTQISSIALKKDSSETLSVEIQPPQLGDPGDFPIVVRARSGNFTAQSDLKVTLAGTRVLNMGTATGRLNADVTAGEQSQVDFLIGNAGTAPLNNLAFISSKPDRWEVNFNPDKVDSLNPGEVREVKMEITAPDRAVAGDYMLAVTTNSPDSSKSIDFRVTVSTPTIWGWIGAFIVAAVVLALAAVFIRLGRR